MLQGNIQQLYIGSEELYYIVLSIGLLLVLSQAVLLIFMYQDKELLSFDGFKSLFAFLIGVLILAVTLPSLKSIIQKEYDVISGDCTIEVDSFGRSASATFEMIETGEQYIIYDIPELDAYGKSIPYYCKVTVTKENMFIKENMFNMGYEIYDVKSRKLLLKND
ncbi:hypothetical protein [Lysinibacillus cavernae]|uniref:hypothetical protein n=1 Tax=Lysinibacillus cavernae TaxID=2666135 RepID=UPI001E28DD89|nr:hypothetical protein [Lysinibacillus cavernae]